MKTILICLLVPIWLGVLFIWWELLKMWKLHLTKHDYGQPYQRRSHHCDGNGQDDHPSLHAVGLCGKRGDKPGESGDRASDTEKLTFLNVRRRCINLLKNLRNLVFWNHSNRGVATPLNI